jgi:hypothetical protein
MLKAEGPLPVEIETEVHRYLESRRSALTQELATVATLAERGKLPDVDLTEGDLKITALRAVTPPEAESLRDAAYDLLPRIKITDLLLEVDNAARDAHHAAEADCAADADYPRINRRFRGLAMVVALLGVLQFIHVVREAVDGGEDFHERHNAVVGEVLL